MERFGSVNGGAAPGMQPVVLRVDAYVFIVSSRRCGSAQVCHNRLVLGLFEELTLNTVGSF